MYVASEKRCYSRLTNGDLVIDGPNSHHLQEEGKSAFDMKLLVLNSHCIFWYEKWGYQD